MNEISALKKAADLHVRLINYAIADGPDAYLHNETPTTLVGLRLPNSLVHGFKRVADALDQAVERGGETPEPGTQSRLETEFLSTMIAQGIAAQLEVLQKMQKSPQS